MPNVHIFDEGSRQSFGKSKFGSTKWICTISREFPVDISETNSRYRDQTAIINLPLSSVVFSE